MSFTEAERQSLANSVCLMQIKGVNSTIQTAWLISSTGFLLTAGHGIEKNKLKLGDRVVINFGDPKPYEATIIDKIYSDTDPVDFALLKLTTSPPSSARPIKLLKSTDSITQKELIIIGFRSENSTAESNIKTTVAGKVTGTTTTSKGDPYFIQLNVENQALHGMSGAPVCIKRAGKVVAIGIQCIQDKLHKKDAFACPLNYIYNSSTCFKNLFEDLEPPILDLDPSLYLETKFTQCSHLSRELLFIEKPSNSYACEVRRLLDNQWVTYSEVARKKIEFDKYIQSQLKKLPWIHYRNLQLTIRKNIIYREVATATFPADTRDTSFLSMFRNASDNFIFDNPYHLRIIFDLDDIVNKQDFENFWSDFKHEQKNTITHLLLVKLGQKNELQSWDNMLVLFLKKPPSDQPKSLIHILFGIIEDITLDICVTNSMKNLFSLYQSVSAKRLFSKAKAEYADSQSITPYMIKDTMANLPYVSFASCAKKSLESRINYDMYYRLWRDFLSDEFSPIGSSSIQRFESVSYDDVESYILNLKRFGGQISKLRLKKQFFNALNQYPNTKHFFFAIYNKRAKEIVHRKNIANLLQRKKGRMNIFSFLPACKLKDIVAYRDNIKLALFKFSD